MQLVVGDDDSAADLALSERERRSGRQWARVLLVGEHVLLADALATALVVHGLGDVRVARDRSFDGVLTTALRYRPDVVLLDLGLGPPGASVPMIAPLTAGGARVFVLACLCERPLFADCIAAGATGIFDKSLPLQRLIEHLADAMTGGAVLRPAERARPLVTLRRAGAADEQRRATLATLSNSEAEVLALLVEGLSAGRVATRRGVSVSTVRSQIRSILGKLEVKSQLAAVAFAKRSAPTPLAGHAHRSHFIKIDDATSAASTAPSSGTAPQRPGERPSRQGVDRVQG